MVAKMITRVRTPAYRHLHIQDTPYGKGVFAKRLIKKGEEVGMIGGEVYDENDFDSDYCMDLGHELVIEPRNVFRRMNHSCKPNCELVALEEADDYRIFVEAIRKIETGDQLTIDYAWPADHAIPCLCSAKKCRGWIVHPDELGELLAKSA